MIVVCTALNSFISISHCLINIPKFHLGLDKPILFPLYRVGALFLVIFSWVKIVTFCVYPFPVTFYPNISAD